MTLPCIATLVVMIGMAAAGCAQRAATTGEQTRTAAVVTQDDPRRSEWLQMFARGYFPGRSGEIFFVPHDGEFLVDTDPLYSFMHGSPWDYDAHLPLLLHGDRFVRSGIYEQPARQQDISPTFARVIGIAPPATTTGRVLSEALAAGDAPPRVAAVFVLDGMRADYWETYAAQLPTLTRLRAEGAWFANMRATSIPTATAIGHANIGTGTEPRVHGLVANQLFNRVTGKSQEAYNALDPGELMALTLADVLNLETDGRAIIIGQGGAIRATAGLVGHGACIINGRKVLAASYSTRDGGWETNDRCYTMPRALDAIRGERFWKEVNGTWMEHPIGNPRALRASAVFQRFEGEALAAVLDSEPIGQDDVTDLVLVNVKSPDYVSHAYGPASAELRETLAELDRQVARAMAILSAKSHGALLLAITADHGMPGEPKAGQRRITITEVVTALDDQFAQGGASVVHYFGDPANAQIYINEARLRELGVSLDAVARFLQERFFQAVFTKGEVQKARNLMP